ncbi:MAG: DUF5331 domain-containing protein [Coleofasciculaceae cyanobacterium]
MLEIMGFFEKFTDNLQQKWLEYFQSNRSWIILQMKVSAANTPDGGKRPSSDFILGVVNALEPKLGNLMVPFNQLNPDAEKLIDVLGLNFDAEKELAKRAEQTAQTQQAEIVPLLTDT